MLLIVSSLAQFLKIPACVVSETDNLPIAPRPLAIVRSYADLHAALRARSDQLAMSRLELDHRAGLADGHAGKLLAPVPIKKLGSLTYDLVLAALGLVLIVAEDSESLARLAERTEASRKMRATTKTRRHRFPKGPEFARIMAARRALKQTPRQRSASARRAAKARWSKAAKAASSGKIGSVIGSNT
jgi:hypothetical protein